MGLNDPNFTHPPIHCPGLDPETIMCTWIRVSNEDSCRILARLRVDDPDSSIPLLSLFIHWVNRTCYVYFRLISEHLGIVAGFVWKFFLTRAVQLPQYIRPPFIFRWRYLIGWLKVVSTSYLYILSIIAQIRSKRPCTAMHCHGSLERFFQDSSDGKKNPASHQLRVHFERISRERSEFFKFFKANLNP